MGGKSERGGGREEEWVVGWDLLSPNLPLPPPPHQIVRPAGFPGMAIGDINLLDGNEVLSKLVSRGGTLVRIKFNTLQVEGNRTLNQFQRIFARSTGGNNCTLRLSLARQPTHAHKVRLPPRLAARHHMGRTQRTEKFRVGGRDGGPVLRNRVSGF